KLAEQYLNYSTVHYRDVVPKAVHGEEEPTFDTVDLETACRYAAEDADVTFRLYRVLNRLLKERGLDTLFSEVEMPLLPLLAGMEMNGIRLNSDALRSYSMELEKGLAGIQSDIFALCGHEFNIASTRQLQQVLFEERKLTPSKKTKTGYSTDMSVLQELAREDPVPALVLRHRLLTKLKSTYVDALPKLVNPTTGRIHTHFNVTGTATGRISSTDPNLQNIPIRDEEGRRIRNAFIPQEGWQFVSADYSQVELVVLAHLSGDPGLRKALADGADVHRNTGSLIFSVPAEEVTAEQRRVAKTINFGVMYGMSAFRLSRELQIPRNDAVGIIDAYFSTYSQVRSFMDQTVADAEQNGYVQTLLGRRRYLANISNRNKTVKQAAERVAVNTPIQGSAADIMKLAMLRMDRAIRDRGLQCRMLLQVHDELIFECPPEEAAEVTALVQGVMEGAYTLTVPLRVSVELGESWGALH
ncbi:MAG: DNA polymerase I, partial [Spirochaetia bacterium]